MAIQVAHEIGTDSYLLRWTPELVRELDLQIWREIARAIAEKYVAEHYQEIVAKIDPQVIATLSVAEAGAAIRKTLEEKIPDKILEVQTVKREVYQKGIFGGVKRVL